MPSCAFRKCNNNTRNKNGRDISFHNFPLDPRYRKIWTEVIRQDQHEDDWLPNSHSKICSKHFKDNDFKMSKAGLLKRIKPKAIPAYQPTPDSGSEQDREDAPGSPLSDVYVSDKDSIFDTPRKFHLKIQLFTEKRKREMYRKENNKLRKQNKYLKLKNASLRALVKQLKNKNKLAEYESDDGRPDTMESVPEVARHE